MVSPRQLILVVLVAAVSTSVVQASTEGDDELQQLTFSQGEDSSFPQVPDDAEITDAHDDQGVDDGRLAGDLPERMIVGDQDVGGPVDDEVEEEETQAAGGGGVEEEEAAPEAAGGQELTEDLTDPGTEEPRHRSDVDEPVKKIDGAFGVPRCEQESDTGVCRAYIPSWYYDVSSATCQEFIYGGCFGNDNNFLTKQHCEAACPDVVPCPEDPTHVCLVSESACMNTTCVDQEDVICRVTPCTCEIEFVDMEGHPTSCDDSTTTPSAEEEEDGADAAGHGSLDGEADDATSKDWMTPTFVTIGIIALVAAVTAAWVVGRRWKRQGGSGYISASSGKPSQYPQAIETQSPDQYTDGSLNV
ncbi:uncharacterized protein [Panulirus ornatus]|uniref:uncharacterized protein isoform X2 n=1 Tax=Panulirus ornatus TaxID=150431 RepID=UPI003A873248